MWGFYYTLTEEPCQWAPTNAKLCSVRRGIWFHPNIKTSVSEAAAGTHVLHSVLHGGTSLSLAPVCHSQLLGEAHIFPFLKNEEQNLYFLTLSVAQEEEEGGSAFLFVWAPTGQSTYLWCRRSWLCSLPNRLRMNPAPCVRHQKGVKESSDQKEQVIKEQK